MALAVTDVSSVPADDHHRTLGSCLLSLGDDRLLAAALT
jgi:hypothetical protein